MIETKDKLGQAIYISYVDDCEENEGGFYCETYSDEWGDNKIDDFCIHTDDCDCQNYDEVEEFIRHYYDDEELDLNWNF
jgi:hypothetical protein